MKTLLQMLTAGLFVLMPACSDDDNGPTGGDNGQSVVTFEKTFGGTGRDQGMSVVQTTDGGYVVTGYTESFGAGYLDVYLIKTDAAGDTLWTRTYGGASRDFGNSVVQADDGGYFVAGYTESFGAGGADVYLIKTAATGDTLWTRTYGGAGEDHGYSVVKTDDGGYAVAGYTASSGAGGADIYLIKTDASGDALWTRTYGGASSDWGYSIIQTDDGGYVVAGGVMSPFGVGGLYGAVYLIKTDASGDTLWTRTFGGTGSEFGTSVVQTNDGGYVVAGWTESFGAGDVDVYLIKTDASGDTLWTRTFGGTDREWVYSVVQTNDGGYVLAGSTASFGAGGYDLYLIKTDASGDTLWTRTYGGTGTEWGYSVVQTNDGGYIVAGSTGSSGAGDSDVYLLKLDAEGNL